MMNTNDVDNNMTMITQRMFTQAASGQMTVCEAVAFLEKQARMRTLREKLEIYSHGCNLQETLVSGLACHHPDINRDFFEKRVSGWLNNPAHQALNRKDAVELCFILKLSLEEANAFVALVSEEGLHWRSPDEIVYIFALKQGMGYAEAQRLNEEMREILSNVEESKTFTENSFTSVIRSEVSALGTKEELADYLRDAVSRLGRYHNNAYMLFMDMMESLECPRLDADEERAEIFPSEKLTLGDILKEYLYEDNVLYARERMHDRCIKNRSFSEEDKFVFSVIQEKVSSGWPDEITLAKMKSRDVDVTRKVLILLFLATDPGPEEDLEMEPSRDEIFAELYQRLNDMLTQCGFMALDARSPFDWLVIYCICVEDMLDVDARMRAVFQEMFGER